MCSSGSETLYLLSLSLSYNTCFFPFICRILYDKRFSAFHYPVLDEDAPNYRSIIQNPMDMATMLQRVDSGQYITCSAFVQDIDLIASNAKVCSLLWLLHVTKCLLHCLIVSRKFFWRLDVEYACNVKLCTTVISPEQISSSTQWAHVWCYNPK